MQVVIIPVTPLAQNCSLLCCEATRKAAVVDPGGDLEKILDHAGAVAELAERLHIPIEGPHREDQFLLEALPQQSGRFGLPTAGAFVPQRWLENGDRVDFGEIELEVLHCPGHTPGHVVFFHRDSRLAIVGDVLFKGSIGRTDFPRSDHASLLGAIRGRLWPLGDDVKFVPGHGPVSTFGEERLYNPFVGERAPPTYY
jgi:glyoxylase-like metal-dependent hydrolase (beta-lactamase superfamily II)